MGLGSRHYLFIGFGDLGTALKNGNECKVEGAKFKLQVMSSYGFFLIKH